MRKKYILVFLVINILLLTFVLPVLSDTNNSNNSILKTGDRGKAVTKLQVLLKKHGFIFWEPDGIFGLQTKLAVKQFQMFFDLEVDSIVGPKTWEILKNDYNYTQLYTIQSGDTIWDIAKKMNISRDDLLKFNNISNPDIIKAGQKIEIPGIIQPESIIDLQWSQVNNLFPIDESIMITDLETGLNIRVKRLFGSNHADVEPLTYEDTKTLKKIYDGKWSWERRGVIVHLNNMYIAGSINGYPHDQSSIKSNNFNGHICLHFRDSKLHLNNCICPEHQNQIDKVISHKWPLGLK